ncbi:uncharacterized protein LOC128737109 [Sabethes cyaneus]|uniref:uncharacterized protein LOC128737109 n=1 Tax=Sabethes cyaneus TaxID=53552 RepID=UPI00237D518F|nr:uncharacterized protein LOC128737109 [Sabethes cyaneus]
MEKRKYAAFCRLCLVETKNKVVIFPQGRSAESRAERLLKLVEIKIDFATEPGAILCFECLAILEEFRKFKEQCHENDRHMQKLHCKSDISTTESVYSHNKQAKDSYRNSESITTDSVITPSKDMKDLHRRSNGSTTKSVSKQNMQTSDSHRKSNSFTTESVSTYNRQMKDSHRQSDSSTAESVSAHNKDMNDSLRKSDSSATELIPTHNKEMKELHRKSNSAVIESVSTQNSNSGKIIKNKESINKDLSLSGSLFKRIKAVKVMSGKKKDSPKPSKKPKELVDPLNEEAWVCTKNREESESWKIPAGACRGMSLDEMLVLADSYPDFFHFEKGQRSVYYTLVFYGERYNSALFTRHHTYWQCYHRRKYNCKATVCATNDYRHFERRHSHTHGDLPEKTGTVRAPLEVLPEIFKVCRNFIERREKVCNQVKTKTSKVKKKKQKSTDAANKDIEATDKDGYLQEEVIPDDNCPVLAESYPDFFHFEKGFRSINYTLVFYGDRYNFPKYGVKYTYWHCIHRDKHHCSATVCTTNDYTMFERRGSHSHAKLPETEGIVYTPLEALPIIFKTSRMQSALKQEADKKRRRRKQSETSEESDSTDAFATDSDDENVPLSKQLKMSSCLDSSMEDTNENAAGKQCNSVVGEIVSDNSRTEEKQASEKVEKQKTTSIARAKRLNRADDVVLADSYPDFFYFEKGPRSANYTLVFNGERYNSARFSVNYTYWQCMHRQNKHCQAIVCVANDYSSFERRNSHSHGKLPEKEGTRFTPLEALPKIFEIARNGVQRRTYESKKLRGNRSVLDESLTSDSLTDESGEDD